MRWQMISESSGMNTLIQSERTARTNQAQTERKPSSQGEESRESSYSDFTTFSPQALALARKVPSPGPTADLQQAEPQGRGQGVEQSLPTRSLDIRV